MFSGKQIPTTFLLLFGTLVAGTGLILRLGSVAIAHEKELDQQQADQTANSTQAKEAKSSRTDRFGDSLPSGALMRIGTIRYRAGASINKAAISPDGKLLAAAHEGGITLIELATGRARPLRETGVPNGFSDNTSILAFSSDGKKLLNVTGGGNLRSWDVMNGKLIHQKGSFPEPGRGFGMPAPVLPPGAGDWRCNQVWFPVAGKSLVVSLANNLPPAGKGPVDSNTTIQFLDSSSWKTVQQFTIAGELASVAGDGKSLAALDSAHSQLVIYDDQGKELRRVGKNPSPYLGVLASDGKLLSRPAEGLQLGVNYQ
jgi:WD40 repeat protein